MARGIVDAVERRFEGANRIFGKSQSDLRVRPVREFVDRVERLVDARSPIAGFGIADTAVSFDRLVEDARESLFENGVVGPEARRGEIEATHQRLVALRRFEDERDERIDAHRLQMSANALARIFVARGVRAAVVGGERGPGELEGARGERPHRIMARVGDRRPAAFGRGALRFQVVAPLSASHGRPELQFLRGPMAQVLADGQIRDVHQRHGLGHAVVISRSYIASSCG